MRQDGRNGLGLWSTAGISGKNTRESTRKIQRWAKTVSQWG
jgi:hypothetical protein